MVPCDLTVAAQTEALAAHALEAFGRIDVLVNVAGGSGPIGKTGWETTSEEFNEIVRAQHDRLLQHHARRAAVDDRPPGAARS